MIEPSKQRNQATFSLCKRGDKIKVYISQEYESNEHTFGMVVALDSYDRPILKYRDYSELKLHEFRKCLLYKDVIINGWYESHGVPEKKEELVYE